MWAAWHVPELKRLPIVHTTYKHRVILPLTDVLNERIACSNTSFHIIIYTAMERIGLFLDQIHSDTLC